MFSRTNFCNKVAPIIYLFLVIYNRRNDVVVKASASHSVDLGFIPFVESCQKTLKMVSITSLLDAQHLWEIVENKPASSLVVSLGKAPN